jgi:hypothetical protein
MIWVAYRAGGVHFDVDAFLIARAIAADRIWHRGEARGKNVHATSGFSLGLPDAGTAAAAVHIVETFLERERAWLSALPAIGANQEIDLGFALRSPESIFPSLTVPAALLAKLGRVGIDLVMTGYPDCTESHLPDANVDG